MPASGDGGPYIAPSDPALFPALNVSAFVLDGTHLAPGAPLPLAHGAQHTYAPAPHAPLFVDPDARPPRVLSFAELRALALRLVSGLRERYGALDPDERFGRGTRAGPAALLLLPNCTAWPPLALGFLGAGWALSAANPAYGARELVHVVRALRPRVVVCAAEALSTVHEALRKCEVAADVFTEDGWTALLSAQEGAVEPMKPKEAERRVAFVLWSSGTTGAAKGVMLSHRAVVAMLVQLWHANAAYSTHEVWLGVPPFFHIFGLGNLLLLGPLLGATVVLIRKYTFPRYLELLSAHRATFLHMAPPTAVALATASLPPKASFASVRGATVGGAPTRVDTLRRVWERTGVLVRQGYGITEGGGLTQAAGGDWAAFEPRADTVGAPLVGVEIALVDAQGREVGKGEEGEVVVRSPGLMLGYVNDADATRGALDERGFWTGDVGVWDASGGLKIVDRIKELIKYKAFQVSPTELESLIRPLGCVADVAVSSVYSAAEGTELPRAFVVLSKAAPTRAEMERAAQEVKMAVERDAVGYKRLRGGVTFVRAIPRNPSGKTLRRVLRDGAEGVEELGHVEVYARGGREGRL